MTLLLTLSTFVTISPGFFFAFVIINGIVQAAAGSYLQTATIQVASLFGPHTVQAMFTGQGAVAFVVSGVQVASATVSTWGASQETISTYVLGDGSAEERSAFIFFGLSTLFLLFSLAAHAWLVSMPIYKTVAAPLEHKAITGSTSDEIQGLVSGHRHEFHDEKKRILRVARLNVTYEVAVAYVFIVTLVSTRSSVYVSTCSSLCTGCLPSYHRFSTNHQPNHAPSAVQCYTFPHVQHRRFLWPIYLLVPSTSHLGLKASFDAFPG